MTDEVFAWKFSRHCPQSVFKNGLGLYGLHLGYMGRMEKKMETIEMGHRGLRL